MCVSHISAAVANVPDIEGTSVFSTAKKQKGSLYLRLNLTISSTSQTFLLMQHQSKATLTRGNIVGKLHNSLCHAQDKTHSKQLTSLKTAVQAKDIIYFYCKQYVSRSVLICMRTEPAFGAWTPYMKTSSILHRQAQRKIFLYKWQGDERELDTWLWPPKRRRLIIICSFA